MGSMASRVSTTRESQTPPPLAPEGRRALGLVTLWDGSATHECAIPLWCQSAQRLASMIPPPWQTQLVVIAPRASDECTKASYVWRNDTAEANDAYLSRVPIKGSWSYLKNCLLLKWSVFAMTEFDLILYTDIDVDLTPSHSRLVASPWVVAMEAFLRSPALIVNTPDHSSPINMGVFLAKPAPWVHLSLIHI